MKPQLFSDKILMYTIAIISLCASEITFTKGGGRSGGAYRSSSSYSRPSSRGSSTIASRPTTTPLKSNPLALPSNSSNALALPSQNGLASTKLAPTNSGSKISSSEPKISNPQSTASSATAYPRSYTPTYYPGYGYNHPIIISSGSRPNNHPTNHVQQVIEKPTWQNMLTDRNLVIAAMVTPIAVASITAGSLYAYYKYTQAQALKKQSLAIAAALQNTDMTNSMITTTNALATNQLNTTPAHTTYSAYPKAIIAYWTKYFKS